MDERTLNRTFARYMSLNILGMLGMSGYILADTFFVSSRLGSDGLAALNLAISVFGFVNGLGMMLGIGGATRYAICKAREDDREADASFSTAFLTGLGAGILLAVLGLLLSQPMARLLGAEERILPMCADYLRTVLTFAPFFILNHILVAFVRNDGNPKLAMAAMLVGSLSNVVLDYVFLFPWTWASSAPPWPPALPRSSASSSPPAIFSPAAAASASSAPESSCVRRRPWPGWASPPSSTSSPPALFWWCSTF